MKYLVFLRAALDLEGYLQLNRLTEPRGPLAIHAGKQVDKKSCDKTIEQRKGKYS